MRYYPKVSVGNFPSRVESERTSKSKLSLYNDFDDDDGNDDSDFDDFHDDDEV